MKNFLRICLLNFIMLAMLGCAGFPRQEQPGFREILPLDPSSQRQVLYVVPSEKIPFKAILTAWEYSEGKWHRIWGPWPAVIGKNGLAAAGEKREGDGKTPSGTFPVKTAFGIKKQIQTGLSYRQTTDQDIWVDDSASGQYNRWAQLPTNAGSYEIMKRSDGLYDLGAVIEYNTDPVVPGHGSAIFIHIWRDNGRKPTSGCVALSRNNLQHLLKWLKASHEPAIILHP